jgi:hypothetical protein
MRSAPVHAAVVAAALLALVALAAAPLVGEPAAWGDDLVWLGDSRWYFWTKVPTEGRWLVFGANHLTGTPGPALAFWLGLACWAGASLLAAFAILGPARPLAAGALALALLGNPGGLSFLLWPMTLLPVMAVLVLGAAASWLSGGRFWATGLVAAGWTGALVLGNQLLALYAAALAPLMAQGLATRGDTLARPAFGPIIAAGGGALLGILGGTLLAFAANRVVFGHFGLAPQPWRAELDAAGALRGVEAVQAAAVYLGARIAEAGLVWLFLVALAAALAAAAALLPAAVREGRAIVTGLLGLLGVGAALGLTFAVPFARGVPLPEIRGTTLLWLALLVPPALLAATTRGARPGALALLLLGGLGAGAGFAELGCFAREDRANRAVVAEVLRDAAPRLAREAPDARTLVLLGNPAGFRGDIVRDDALAFWADELFQFEGRRALPAGVAIRHCPRACPGVELSPGQRESLAVAPAAGSLARIGDAAVLRIGP